MYKVLVVDDEQIICVGIKKIIEHINNPLISNVYTAFNGYEAQKIVKTLNPQIIITDIKMPEISGLKLIEKVFEYNSSIKIIALSSYDEFQYVKEAFKLGVEDYLKKPASIKEIKEVLEKVIQGIEKQKKTKLIAKQKDYLYRQAILENNLNKIFINFKTQSIDVEEILYEWGIKFPYENFCLAIFGIQKSIYNGSLKKSDLDLIIKQISKEYVKENNLEIFCFFNYNNDLVILFNCKSQKQYINLIKYLNSLYKSIKVQCNVPPAFSISNICEGIDNISELYWQANRALMYRLIYGYNNVIKYKDIRNRLYDTKISKSELDKVKEYILESKKEDILHFVDKYFDEKKLENQSIDCVADAYNKMCNIINEMLSHNNILSNYKSFKEFLSFYSLSDLRVYLKKIIFYVIDILKVNANESTVIDIAKKYIEDNFNRDINMAVVANKVGVSYNYFSKLFRTEIGMTFSEYLTKIRLEKAKKILENPINKIYEVAQRVGYNDAKYFTKVFKKYYGKSPKQYNDKKVNQIVK